MLVHGTASSFKLGIMSGQRAASSSGYATEQPLQAPPRRAPTPEPPRPEPEGVCQVSFEDVRTLNDLKKESAQENKRTSNQ